MIYIKYNRDKFYIDKDGKTVYQMPHNNLAVFTDTSAASNERNVKYRYYSINKETGIYFLEQNIYGSGCRSLLHALNLRDDAIVGIYSSRRLLLFQYSDGKLKKFRITSDDVDDPDAEIQFTINKWGCPDDISIEVYGYNIPFSELYNAIQQTPVFRDAEKDRKRRQVLQITAGAALIAAVICGYIGVSFYEQNLQNKIKQVKDTNKKMIEEVQLQAIKRLPLYLCSNNIPFDAVLKELSFLEDCKYTALKVSVSNDDIITTVTVIRPEDAYKIKQYVNNAQIKINGGVIEISFSKSIKRDSDIFGGCNYNSYFAF